MKDDFINHIKPLLPNVDYCSFRFVSKYINIISATRGVVEPVIISEDDGLMVTVYNKGGYGYGATSNLTREGIIEAVNIAMKWAKFSENKLTYFPDLTVLKPQQGSYYTDDEEHWSENNLAIRCMIFKILDFGRFLENFWFENFLFKFLRLIYCVCSKNLELFANTF